MNICLLTSTYLPLVGGLEIVVHNLASALSDLGHHVYVVTPRPYNRKFVDNYGYKIVRFGFKGYGRLKLPPDFGRNDPGLCRQTLQDRCD